MTEERNLEVRPENRDLECPRPPERTKAGEDHEPPGKLEGYRPDILDAFLNA
jgi:hypothetical protein